MRETTKQFNHNSSIELQARMFFQQ